MAGSRHINTNKVRLLADYSTTPVLKIPDRMPIATQWVGIQNNGRMIQAWRRSTHERRADCRYRLNAPTLVRSKTDGIAAALVLEASASGFSLSMPFRLPVNTEIEIRLEDKVVSGLIRNCVCIRAMEFHAGVQILASTSNGEKGLTHLRLLQRAKALNMFSPVRTSPVWASLA